jgi:hypothetical protein
MTNYTLYCDDADELRDALVRIAPHLIDCPVYWCASRCQHYASFVLP